MISNIKHSIIYNKFSLIISCFVSSLILGNLTYAADHLIAVSHKNDVNKMIAVYDSGGAMVFSYTPPGSFFENTPRFIRVIPSLKRFFVTCPNGDSEDGGTIEAFDYSGFPGSIIHLKSILSGNKPYHIYVTPDNKICSTNDGDDAISLIDPSTFAIETIDAGHHHATIGFPVNESGYDIFATRFMGSDNPGGVDIIDGITKEKRLTDSNILPLPHSVVYSTVTKKVYISCAGGIEVFGTQGAEKDVHLKTILTTEGHMTPSLRISPDGQHIVGNCHWDAEPGSYFFSIDLQTEKMTKVNSVSCKGYAYSPDGKWIAAGDFNKPFDQDIQVVHLINCDPDSVDYMTVAQQFELSYPSQIGFFAQDFSPDSKKAYLGLTQSDQIMVVDVETFSASYIDCEAAPYFLSVLPLSIASSVNDWSMF